MTTLAPAHPELVGLPDAAATPAARPLTRREIQRAALARRDQVLDGGAPLCEAGAVSTRREVQHEVRSARRRRVPKKGGSATRGATHADEGRAAPGSAADRLLAVLAACFVVVALLALAWHAAGGRLLVMSTQSMCPRTCVGSLVVDAAPHGPYRAGELISFQPPGSLETYTHRVFSVHDGTIRTKGDANSYVDPWTLTAAQVSGRVLATIWGVGWLYRLLPFLVIGTVGAAFVLPRLRRRNRGTYLTAWFTGIVVMAGFLVRPFARGALLDAVADPRHPHWVLARVVNTGLLPTSISMVHGQRDAWLGPSQISTLAGPAARSGYLGFSQWVVLPWWGWALVAIAICSPLLGFAARSASIGRIARASAASRT